MNNPNGHGEIGKPTLDCKSNETTCTFERWPVEDEANIDTSRAELGMEPLARYLKRFGIQDAPPSATER